MKFKAIEVASFLRGEVVGDGEVYVTGVSRIEEGKPGTLTFLSNPKYEHYIYETKASVVLVDADFVPKTRLDCTLIKVPSAYDALSVLLEIYEKYREYPAGIESPSFIHESAEIGKNPYVGAFAYIGKNAEIGDNVRIYPNSYVGDGVKIGDNTVIYPGVKIYYNTHIGKRCIVHSGAVIGSDGFGFAPTGNTYKKIPQIGNVIIEDEVEIGANTCIDRSTMGATVVKKGAKLDNLIQLGHNVCVGENTVIAGQAGIAGSTKIGTHCVIGGQVGLVGHLHIGDNVQIAAQSGVAADVENDSILRGSPAFKMSEYQRSYVIFRRLPQLYDKLAKLERELEMLKSNNNVGQTKNN